MTRLQTLIDEQNTVWTRMQDIARAAEEQARDWTAEERTNWDQAEARLSEVSGDIERLNRAAQLEQIDYRQVVTTGTPEGEGADPDAQRAADYAEAFGAYIRGGMSGVTPEQQRLLQRQGRSEERALATGTDAAGGFLVPEDFRTTMTETMKAFGGLLNHANVITTATGNPLPWATNDDTGNEGAILGENTQIGEQDFTFGDGELGAYTYTSKLVRVPWTLLQDSAFALEPWLARKLGERIGRAEARHLAVGTGTGQPLGLVTGATVGVTGAVGPAAITYDNLIDLEHSVNPAYRPRGRYLMGDGGLKVIRKLKDADGRPIWVPIPAPGFPATINGMPYDLDFGMADPAPGARSVLFGDIFAGYVVRVVQGIQLVTMKERYADYLQNGYFAYSRMDATVDDAAAVRALQHGAAA